MSIKTGIISLLMIVWVLVSTNTIAQHFHWVKQMGSSGWDEGKAIAIDSNNDVYSAGHFEGTVDFDPGVGTYNLTSIGQYDAVVCKLDANGNFLWAKQFGDSATVEVNAMVLDPQDNICITGSFMGQVDFNPGVDTLSLTSSYFDRDIFIQKLDVDGNFV